MENQEQQVVTQLLLSLAKPVCAFRTSLSAETDRGCALMAASYLDSQLERLLKARLIADSKIVEALFAPSGPLGTFSARIDLAFAMGLLDSNTHRELHLVRRIRNEFGHSFEPLSFEADAIRNRCTELKRIPHHQEARPRLIFTRTVMGLLASIHGQLGRSTQPTVAADRLTPEVKQLLGIEMERVKAYLNATDLSALKDLLELSDSPMWDLLQRYFAATRSSEEHAASGPVDPTR